MLSPEQLSGTHVRGSVRVAEAAINTLLAGPHADGRAPLVELRPGNVAAVRYGPFSARVELPPAIAPGPRPTLTLTLASLVVALALKAVLRQPFVHVRGRQVTIELSEVPALAPWRAFFPSLTSVQFASAQAALRVDFVLDISGR